MATKAKTTTRRASTAKAASTRTTRPVTARTTTKTTVAARPVAKQKTYQQRDDISGAQLIAEALGMFLLVTAITVTGGNELFVGLSLAMIAGVTFAISGAHINPAVTFGLFVLRKVGAARMAAYWLAQFFGAALAFFTYAAFAGVKAPLSFSAFWALDWKIFLAEVIGTAIFVIGVVAASRRMQTDGSKAAMIGLSLMIALVISGGLVKQASSTNTDDKGNAINEHLSKVSGTILNPAAALTATEKAASSASMLGTSEADSEEAPVSRLGVETVFGPLVGAAIGAGLYHVLGRRNEQV